MAPKIRRLPPATWRAISRRHLDLTFMALGRVGVRAVDHQRLWQAGGAERVARRGHARFVVVRSRAAAQDDVAVGIAARVDHRHLAALVHPEEVVRPRRRLDRIAGDAHVAVRAVLEADWRRRARCELAVHLALRGSRANRTPCDQVADVLRRDRVEELAARRYAEAADVDQELPRDAQPFADPAALVEMRIVDEPLPADRRPRLLEVDAHDDLEHVRGARTLGGEPSRVVERARWVVDRARADDDEQPIVLAAQDVTDARAGRRHQRLDGRALDRKEADQVLGRWQEHHVGDVLVVGARRAVVMADHAFGAGQVRIRGHRFWLGAHAAPAGAHYRRCDSG